MNTFYDNEKQNITSKKSNQHDELIVTKSKHQK